MKYGPDQQHNMRSRMESYTPREFDRAVGDGAEKPEYEPEPECECVRVGSDLDDATYRPLHGGRS